MMFHHGPQKRNLKTTPTQGFLAIIVPLCGPPTFHGLPEVRFTIIRLNGEHDNLWQNPSINIGNTIKATKIWGLGLNKTICHQLCVAFLCYLGSEKSSVTLHSRKPCLSHLLQCGGVRICQNEQKQEATTKRNNSKWKQKLVFYSANKNGSKAIPLQVSHVVWGRSFISQMATAGATTNYIEIFQNWETQLQPPHDKHRSNNLVETRLSSLVGAYENILVV